MSCKICLEELLQKACIGHVVMSFMKEKHPMNCFVWMNGLIFLLLLSTVIKGKYRPVFHIRNWQKILYVSGHSFVIKSSLASPDPFYSADGHQPVRIEAEESSTRRKMCSFCNFQGKVTPSGLKIRTRFKCAVCEIPLCTGENRCFDTFHRLYYEGRVAIGPGKNLTFSTSDSWYWRF